MKQLCIFLLILLLFQLLLCSEDKLQIEKFHHKARQPSSELGNTLPDANSYFEGWVHYYHYTTGPEIKRPKLFFQNNEFFAQRVPVNQIKQSDKFGSLIIPNKSSFYLVLNPTTAHLYSSRDDSIKKQVDSLHYEYIKPIPEDAFMKGGVKDLGSFSIGHCFEIIADLPNGNIVNDMTNSLKTTWIFCLDKLKDKQKLMKTILKLKLKQQRAKGEFKTEDAMKAEAHSKSMADLMYKDANKVPKDDRSASRVESPVDGYWLLLQNWTDCTLKCGGGESFQQWQCIPPKNGGKPCKGDAVRVRKCNIQPCPGAGTLLAMLKATQPEVRKPIIKTAPFSTRLQRNEKCVVKENDAFLTTFDEKLHVEQKLPVRVVMNNATVTIFKDDSYQNIDHSYELKQTAFILNNEFCCFELSDPMRKTKLCGYEKNCGDPKDNKWAKEWAQDFTLFKVECAVGKQETLLSPDDEKQLAEALKKKLGQARMDIIGDKQQKLRQQMMMGQNNDYKQKVQKTQDLGFAAIEKELQLENLIKGEEKAKEESEIRALQRKIEMEKEKQACLHNTIKERDLDAEFLSERRTSEQEVKEIKEEVAQQVKIKRANMKKLIEQMRAKANVRKSALEAELNALRQKMAQEMLQANKNGDIEKCKTGKTDVDKREAYCNINFIDDFVRNSDCKTEENFCYMCCETEFGNMYIDRRESCYNMCDLPVIKPPKKPSPDGPWMWTPKVSK